MGALPLAMFFSLDEASAIVEGAGTPTSTTTNTAAISAGVDYASSIIQMSGGATQGSVEFDFASEALTSGWVRFVFSASTASTAGSTFFSLFGPTLELFRLRIVNTSEHWEAEYYNGSTWAQIGSDITSPVASASAVRIDIRFIIANSGGEFTVYANGASVASFTGDTLTTADTTITKLRVYAGSTSSAADFDVWLPIVVDSADTRNMLISESTASANGAETGWTNGEPEIDEFMGNPNLADFITGDANGETETFTFNSVAAALTGNTVDGVVIVAVAKAQVDPGLYLKGIVRVSSTNYESSNATQPEAADWSSDHIYKFDNDPSTSSEWANIAAVDAAQYGVRVNTTP